MSFAPKNNSDNSFELSSENSYRHVLNNVPTFGSFIIIINSDDSSAPTATFAVSKNYYSGGSINRLTNCFSADKRMRLNLEWEQGKMYPNLYYIGIVNKDTPVCTYTYRVL